MRIEQHHLHHDPALQPVPLAAPQPDAGAAAPPPPPDASAAPPNAAAYGPRQEGLDWYATYGRGPGTAPPLSHEALSHLPPAPLVTPLDTPPPSSDVAGERGLLELSTAELRALSDEQKRAFLRSLGIPEKHLKKTKGAKLDTAFMQAVSAMRSPGTHKLTLKLDKKYQMKTRVAADGQVLDVQVKKKQGFLSKLGGLLKMAAPILGIVLAPLTGGLSLIASSAIGAVDAIKNKNWLGAIASVAGAFVPGTGSFLSSAAGAAGKTVALAGQTVARVASAVQQGAYALQAGMMAVRAKSPGALLGAVAGGIGAVAGGMGAAAGRVGETSSRLVQWGERLQTWANVVGGAEQLVQAVRSKDYLGAAGGALGAAAGLTKGEMSQNLARYSGWVEGANRVQWGVRTGDYLAAAQGSLGLARDLRTPLVGAAGEPNKRDRVSERLGQALELVRGASYLQAAVRGRNAAGIAQAGLLMGGAVEGIRSRALLDGGVNGSSGTSHLGEQLYRAARVVGWADQAARAVKYKDYASAAAAGLGLAAEVSQAERWATAERVGERAAELVTAIRGGHTGVIAAATSSLMEQVGAEREKARASQQQLVKELPSLPTIKPVDISRLILPAELPGLVSGGSTSRPLVDVASLGDLPPLPPRTRHEAHHQATPQAARATPLPATPAMRYEDALHVLLPPGEKKLSETQVLIAATRQVYKERGLDISNAAAEEIVGRRLAVIDHTDARSSSEPDYVRDRAGNLVLDQNRQPMPAHRVLIDEATKQGLLEMKDEALRITRSGTPAVREMTSEQRYARVQEIYNEKYAAASDRQALAGIFSWENLGMMAAVEGSLLTPAGPVVVGTLGAKFLVSDLPKMQQEAVAIKRLIYSPNKVSDLEEAAARLAALKTAGKVVVGSAVLGGVARAGAQLGSNTAAGVQLPEVVPSGRAVVTEGGGRLPFKIIEPGKLPSMKEVVAGVPGEAATGVVLGGGVAGATAEGGRGVGEIKGSFGGPLGRPKPLQMGRSTERFLGGQRANSADVAAATEELAPAGTKIVRGADAEIKRQNPKGVAAFDPERNVLLLPKDMTRYQLFHEKAHALHHAQVGKEAYKAMGRLAREEHVYQQIMANKHQFSDVEIRHATDYIRDLRIAKSMGRID